MLYGVYQDLVHQNSGDHLDGVIAEDSKWQDRWKKLVCMPTQQYEKLSRKSGKIFVGILFVELDGIRARKWNAERVIFLNQLPFNVHKMLTIPRKFKSSFCFVSTCGIVDRLTISWKTHTTQPWGTPENIVGIKIKHFQILFWRENYQNPYDSSMTDKRFFFCNLTNLLRISWAWSTKSSLKFWRGKILAKQFPHVLR